MIKKLVNYLKSDYDRRTLIFASLSILINFIFALYNGIYGILNNSIWPICIFVYYIFLLLLKLLLVLGEIFQEKLTDKKRFLIVLISFISILATTLAMIGPAIILIQNKKGYDYGLIPSLIAAIYTTYSVTLSIMNMVKVKANDNIFVKQIRLTNLVATLMSILVLQNTLISANKGYNNGTTILSICSTTVIFLFIFLIVIFSLIKSIKRID